VTQHLPTNIKKYLRSNPQKSAREIAKHLNTTRREINSILYRDPDNFISVGTDPPLWHLSSSVEPVQVVESKIEPIPRTRDPRIPSNPHRQHKNFRPILENSKDTTSEILHIEDFEFFVQKLNVAYTAEIIASIDESIFEEKITKAWIRLNIPTRSQKRFRQLMTENQLIEEKSTVGDLFSSDNTLRKSEIIRNLQLLILLDGYTSIPSIAEFSTQGKLHQHCDFQLLQRTQPDPIISRLTDDLEILNRRAKGETLDAIAPTYGLTRERIRQRQRDMSVYGIEISSIAIRNQKKNAADDRKQAIICQYILNSPGCTYEEIQMALGFTQAEVRRLTPMQFKKFLAPIRRVGYNSMTQNQILDAIRMAATLEYPLSGPGFDELINSNLVTCVSRVRILQIFGTWSRACELAGVESLTPVRPSYDRIWSQTDLWEYLMDFVLDPDASHSVGEYDKWARDRPGDRPSSGTLRNYLGQWSEILAVALVKLRDEPYNEKFRRNLESSVNKS